MDGTLIERFVSDVCNAHALWTPSSIAADAISHMSKQVGDEHVILGLSGGVDSSVTAALLHRAIGDQLHCVFVDNGLLRLNEGGRVDGGFLEHRSPHHSSQRPTAILRRVARRQ